MSRFQQFINMGLTEHLLPIVSSSGIISGNSKLNQIDAGKQPGIYNPNTDTWTGYPGWSVATTIHDDLVNWNNWPSDLVGIRTRVIPAIDIDVNDPVLVKQINDLITAYMGDTATRSRDNSPRLIRFFRLAPGEIPQAKRRIILNDGQAVELLGAGQQAITCGTHPSGGLQTFTGEMIEITVEHLDMLWDGLIALLEPITIKTTKAGYSFTGERKGGEVVYVAEDEATINKAREYVQNQPEAEQGERDDTCYKIATHVRQYYGIPEEKTAELLIEWGGRCDPVFTKSDVIARVASAYSGCARAAQGEQHPEYLLQQAGFSPSNIPDYVSPVPIEPVVIEAEKKSKPAPTKLRLKEPEIPKNGAAYPITSPIRSSEWNTEHVNSRFKPYSTLLNFEYMLSRYDIHVGYDVIKKKLLINGPGMVHGSDISDNANWSQIVNLVKMNNMETGIIEHYMNSLMIQNESNPVAEWIKHRKWDGVDRITELFNTLTLDPEQDRDIAWLMFRKWLIGAVRIVQSKISRFEFVLILQDHQGGKGKTAWFNKLCPEPWRKDGVMLDTSDKDTVKQAISYWLVELGELDSIFRKADIKRLMSFLSNEKDEIRLPYSKSFNEYRRRTAFFGTVNPREFLQDDSGDRRFWPIAVTAVDYEHNIDMQQLWAQVDTLDEPHWLNQEENVLIMNTNKEFKSVDPVDEALDIYFSKAKPGVNTQCLTITVILQQAGIINPTKSQINKGGRWLRDNGYVRSQHNGTRCYEIPVISVF